MISTAIDPIVGHGETARLIRARDWQQTGLGDTARWPAALVDTLNLILAAPIPMQLFWGDDLLCFYNDAMAALLNSKHPHALGQPARAVWAEAWDLVGSQLKAVYQRAETVSMTDMYVPVLVHGVLTDCWWTYSYSPVYDREGQVVGVLDIAQNTTSRTLTDKAEAERKQAEQESRQGQEYLRLALDAAVLAAWFYDPERNLVGGDSRMGTLFGLAVPEGPAELWLAAIVEEDRARVGREFEAALGGAPYATEYRVKTGDKVTWIRATAARIEAQAGQTARLVGICEDISERKERELQVRVTLERLALAEQVGQIAAWELNPQTGILSWDAAGTWVYGRPPAEVATLEAVRQFIDASDLDHVLASLTPALEGRGEFESDFRVCWPDGSIHWLIGKGKPILDENGRVVRINGVNIDVTSRRTAEAALRLSEKLAAVGQLASTIAHEINNPLEAVTNLLYICKNSTDDPNLLQYLNTAETELRRMAVITSQTLRFHKQLSRATEVTCLDLFSNSLLIYQGRIQNAGIRVERRKRAEQPVLCMEGEIRQVMNNLIGNAVDAMKQGGRLIVRSTEGTDWKAGRRGLRLTVADTGTGMTAETLRHLYQPFFTTKGIGGTGLGLWISRDIVERHHGRLQVRSSTASKHHGTVFHLFLPFQA